VSKCPRGHLLILMITMPAETIGAILSKCPRGHLLILIKADLEEAKQRLGLNAREGIC